MSEQKKFNVLAALGSAMNKVQKGEKFVPKEVNVDPNRLSWPYLKVNDLKKDVSYQMRLLPPHPTKNPLGYVKKKMYQIPMELDMKPVGGFAKHTCKIVTMPGCVDENLPDPIDDILKKVWDVYRGPTAFEFIETGKDEEGNPTGHYDLKEGEEPTLSDLFRDEFENDDELSTFISVLSKPWVQNIMPVILYADVEVEKRDKYNVYKNYEPAEACDEKMLTRRFQMTEVKAFYDEKAGFITKLREKTNDPKDRQYVQWNNENKGMDFFFMHTSGQGAGKSYTFDPDVASGVTALPESIAEKLEVSDDNYPDLVQSELKNGLKSPDEMLNLFLESPYAEKLRPFGILD